MSSLSFKIYQEILVYKRKNNTFPSFNYLEKLFNLTRQDLIKHLKELEKEGYLLKQHNKYVVKEKNKKENNINFIFIFKVFILIIGIISTFMSIYYTYIWFLVFLNPVFSILLSISMVGFSVISFESILLFYNRRNYFLIVFFSFLWLVVIIFSMTSTLAGQYNKILENQSKNVDLNNDSLIMIIENIDYQITELQTEKNNKRVERGKLMEFLGNIKDFEDQNYKDLNYRIYLKNNDLKSIDEKLTILNNKKIKLLEENKIDFGKKQELDFYQWLSNILKVEKFVLQFFLSLFPALFIDIISSISFGLIMFLKN